MKKAVMALDGGGSNLRILVVDEDTNEKLFSKDIETGTNLSSVPNEEKALKNVEDLIYEGFKKVQNEYYIRGIALSSAGTEIEENKRKLEDAIKQSIEKMQKTSHMARVCPPKYFVTNDIEILLHASDIAIVGGTGTVGAVKYKKVQTFHDEEPEEVIYKLDANGQFIGDKGSGYWIGKEVLTKVAEIINLNGYMNSEGKFVKVPVEYVMDKNGDIVEVPVSYLKDLVLDKLSEVTGTKPEDIVEMLKGNDKGKYVELVYSATTENGKPFDRAKVGNLFSRIADIAAAEWGEKPKAYKYYTKGYEYGPEENYSYFGDETANDILKHASKEIFKNIAVAYEKGNFDSKEHCNLLLSGSVLVHSNVLRSYLVDEIQSNYPNISIKVNDEKPVWSTVRYVKDKMNPKGKEEVVR